MKDEKQHSEIIKRSHERSIRYGIDKGRVVSKKILSGEDVSQNIRNNREIIRIAYSFMKNLYDFLVGSGFILVLTDREGCILNIIGDNETVKAAKESDMVIGAYMDEKSIGTNAMGTAISENSPIQVSATEHFITAYHRWTCSAAPIHNMDGEIIGTLNLTGASNLVHPHTLGIVVAAVKSIELQMKNEIVQNKLMEAYQYNNTIMNSISYGILAVDRDGKINNVNDTICIMLKSRREDLLNTSIEKFLSDWKNISNNLIYGGIYQDEEVTLTIENKRERYIFNIHPIKDENNNVIGMVLTFKEIQRVMNLVNKYTGMRARYTFEDFIGESDEIKKIVEYAKQVADSPTTILIEGESGTGKEVLAQAIHNYSSRRENGFIAINCGALPKNLIESELFGYDEGAFTGAKKGGQPGKFELASGGTLFLDEIGEMPLELQVNLLRVLQEGYTMRVGGNKYIPVNVRIIAASNRDLEKEIEKGNFREDLYYRLSVIPITIPPLRERKSDIKPLADHFIKTKSLKLGRDITTLSDEMINWMYNNEWRGNIRELENFIEKIVVLEGKPLINALTKDITKENISKDSKKVEIEEDNQDMFICSLEELEKKAITAILKKFDNNMTKVAEVLDISRNTLYLKLKKYNIKK